MLSKNLLSTLGILIAFCFFVCFEQKVFAQNKQEPCGFTRVHENLLKTDEKYREALLKDAQRWVKVNQNDFRGGRTEATILRIPLVVHVMHLGEAVGTGTNICDEQIFSAIKALNEDYRKMTGTPGFGAGPDTEIEFYLAARDPMGNATNGINRVNASAVTDYATQGIISSNELAVKALSNWSNTAYYNIWLVSEIDDNNGGAGTQGYAYFPGASNGRDGTVALFNAFGTVGNLKSYTKRNGTATHELGHAFRLQHTFHDDGSGSTCPSNGNCNTEGDEVCDTPAHRRDDNGAGCGTTGTACAGEAMGNIRTNYMNYTGDACYSMFTVGQTTRMRDAITMSRNSLTTSVAGNPVTAPVCNFITDVSLANVCNPYPASISVCAGTTIQFYDRSTQLPTSWAWTFAGGNITNSTNQNPSVTYNTPGSYTVTLVATNGVGAGTMVTKTAHVNVYANALAACTPSFDNTGNFGYGIYNVTLNTINNTTTNSNGYTNAVCSNTTTLSANTNYSLSITVGRNNAAAGQVANYRVWIDYNNDGAFNNTDELILSGTKNAVSQETFTQMFTTPMSPTANAVLRLRVANDQSRTPSNTCGVNFFTGEVEDYGVIFTSATPTITLSAAALTAFTACAGTASTTQTYTVGGTNLTANIVITAPTGFEISSTGGAPFSTSLNLTPTTGTVGTTTITVRQTSGASNGANGNITHTSTGATTQNKVIPASTVNALPTITGVSTANVNTSATSFQLSYTGTTGLPDQYSITTGATAMAGFTPITNAALTASPISITIPASAANTYDFNLIVRNSTTGCVSAVVPFTLTVSSAATPTITLSAANLTAFTSCAGTASATQTYTVGGTNLTADIAITAPTGFEISSTGGAPFSTSLNLSPTTGTVGTTTITVRQTSGASNGANGNITHTSTGATTQNKAILASTVNPLPTITGVSAAGVNTAATSFQLSYTGTSNSPNQYSITTGTTAMAGFTPITNASLTASPMSITIPASAANTYDFNLIVRNSTTGCVSAVVPFTLTVSAPLGTILLVNPAGAGGTKLSTVVAADWTTKAYPSLQAALDVAVSGDEIWVKQGIYLPTKDASGNATPADNRTKTFKIPNGINLYGGFAGTETAIATRNFTTNITTLSGDIGVSGTNTDNSYNVVIINGNATETRLDGFTVEKGHDDRASSEWGKGIYINNSRAIIVNCIVTNNTGVTTGGFHKYAIGIYVGGTGVGAAPHVQILNSTISNNIGSGGGGGLETKLVGTLLIRHCIFNNNSASTDLAQIGTGGAIQLGEPNVIINLENSLLVNNVANGTIDDGGGAIMIYNGTLNVSNCTIANNSTTGSVGGGIRKSPYANTNLTINNSIIYGNTSVNSVVANDIQVSPGLGGTLVINNGLLQCPLPASASGSGNINDNPRFVSATDFTLQTNSPCLNAGSNALIPAGITTDLAGNGRTFATTVDMGAYELQSGAVAPLVPSVSIAALPAGAICAGTNVTFTATPTNGGATPAYQWKVNGSNVGTNSATYTTNALVNGDIVSCVLTPSDICNTYISNTITTVINIMYVRTDGNDANTGFANTPAGAKLTLQAAINTVLDGCTIVLNTGTYNETATVTNKSFTLQSVGNPTLQSLVVNGTGKTITLTGNLNISEMVNLQVGDIASNGNLTLSASATKQAMLIQGAGTNVTGNVNIQRYLRANTGTTGLGYRFVSSPTSNATLNQLSELNPVVNANFNTAAFPGRTVPFPTVYSYDPTKAGDPAKTFYTTPYPEFDKGWVSPAALTEAMGVGKGFTVNTAANQVTEITGTVNNGNVTIPVVTGNAFSLAYNLVGNPYPSPIRWSLVKALSPSVNDAIYQNMATGQYTGSWASFVGGVGTNGATDDIAVMQGFFVIANAGGNVVMNNTVRATAYTNPSSFRTEDDKNANKNQGLLRLAMTNSAGKTDETVVYFSDKATQNFDNQYDAVKFQLNGGNFPNIYTTDAKTLFSINALPNLTDDLVIPITVQSWTNGTQKIAMTEKVNFTREVQVFLKDKSTDKLHDLSKGSFEFAMSAGVIADRFELIFKPQFTQAELNGDILNVYPNPTADVLTISIGDDYKGVLTLRLIDVSGREVWSEKTEKSGKIYQTSTSLQNLASGTYFLEVEGEKKVVKKIVKN